MLQKAVAEVVMCVPMMMVFKTLPSKVSGTHSSPSYGGGDDGDELAAIKVMTTALTLPLKVSSTRSSPCEPLTLSTLTYRSIADMMPGGWQRHRGRKGKRASQECNS